MADTGPAEAGINNKVFNEHYVRVDLEVRGQGKHRRAAALSALSRADWDIATQEVTVAIATVRAFQTVVYRDLKLKVLDETVRLDEPHGRADPPPRRGRKVAGQRCDPGPG